MYYICTYIYVCYRYTHTKPYHTQAHAIMRTDCRRRRRSQSRRELDHKQHERTLSSCFRHRQPSLRYVMLRVGIQSACSTRGQYIMLMKSPCAYAYLNGETLWCPNINKSMCAKVLDIALRQRLLTETIKQHTILSLVAVYLGNYSCCYYMLYMRVLCIAACNFMRA